jgi:hypothetical protein
MAFCVQFSKGTTIDSTGHVLLAGAPRRRNELVRPKQFWPARQHRLTK